MKRVRHTRILSLKQIQDMPLHNLKRYRHSIKRTRAIIHSALEIKEYCCSPKSKHCNLIFTIKRDASAKQLEEIKTLDWLNARCDEEYNKKIEGLK